MEEKSVGRSFLILSVAGMFLKVNKLSHSFIPGIEGLIGLAPGDKTNTS